MSCRGTIQVKGKGEMVTYFLNGKRSHLACPLSSSLSRKTSQPSHIGSSAKETTQKLSPVASDSKLLSMIGPSNNNNQVGTVADPTTPTAEHSKPLSRTLHVVDDQEEEEELAVVNSVKLEIIPEKSVKIETPEVVPLLQTNE
jgi:hypothetical protein